jgi:hypothetical protein
MEEIILEIRAPDTYLPLHKMMQELLAKNVLMLRSVWEANHVPPEPFRAALVKTYRNYYPLQDLTLHYYENLVFRILYGK